MNGEVVTGAVPMFEPADETLIDTGVLTLSAGLVVVGAETGTTDSITEFALDPEYSAGAQSVFYLKATIGDTITIVDDPTGSNIAVRGGSDYVLTGEDIVPVLRMVATSTAKVTNKFVVMV